MPAMPWEPIVSPEGDFAVWELPCRSKVGLAGLGSGNAPGRDLRVAGDGGGTGRLTRRRVTGLI